MLQIVKCEDRNCCSIPRSSYFNLIIDHFLPPPLPLSQSDDGLAVNLESQNFASLFTTIALGKKFSHHKLLNSFQSEFHTIMPAQLCKANCQREFAVSADCIVHL